MASVIAASDDAVAARRVRRGATAQGLVRFDAAGRIEPALAERWIVIDDGRSYIFRLRRARWSDGSAVTATDVATALRRRLSRRDRNPLAPYLTAIGDVVAMTPRVIEVRLQRSRPDLLKLFAQPELAIVHPRNGRGTGPFREEADGSLRRVATDGDAMPLADTPEQAVRLRGERAAVAIVRFTEGKSDLVLGGTVADWPLVSLAGTPPGSVRIDPASGLFGLVFARRTGLFATAEARTALAGAIDRDRLLAGTAPGWRAADRLLPAALDSDAAPAEPFWAAERLADRRARFRSLVDRWREAGGDATIRIALPDGAGMRRFAARLAADLADLGLVVDTVPPDRSADLRLIDAVAPFDSARWYLEIACSPCDQRAADAIEAARVAPTIATRARALAVADRALADDGAFIPIARPWRWSLVAVRLRAFQPNDRAWHPLNHLRAEPR